MRWRYFQFYIKEELHLKPKLSTFRVTRNTHFTENIPEKYIEINPVKMSLCEGITKK